MKFYHKVMAAYHMQRAGRSSTHPEDEYHASEALHHARRTGDSKLIERAEKTIGAVSLDD
jgi:hypothetical protein